MSHVFLIEYLCITCVMKKLTKEWLYFFLDDAERTGMYPKKSIHKVVSHLFKK
jgi:hypothetical protein